MISETGTARKFVEADWRLLFTKAENVAVSILDIKIEARPRSLFKRLEHLSPTHFQLAEQAPDPAYGNVRIQMFVLFPVFPVGGQFRRTLEMYPESVARDRGVERLILKIKLEAKLVAVVCNCPAEIIDEKLRGYPCNVRRTATCDCGHLIPLSLTAVIISDPRNRALVNCDMAIYRQLSMFVIFRAGSMPYSQLSLTVVRSRSNQAPGPLSRQRS